MRLAWAITIHKSQGLTFDKAIVDAGEAFSAGQVYVALSRCTNLEGMVLQSRINKSSLRCDERIIQFSQNKKSADWLKEELGEAGKSYQQEILLSLFDFNPIIKQVKELLDYLIEYGNSFNSESLSWIKGIEESVLALQGTAEKFHSQLISFFEQPQPLELNDKFLERTKAASSYFIQQIERILQIIPLSPVTTDSRQHAKEYNEGIKDIFSELFNKKQLLTTCNDQFNIENYHKVKNTINTPALSVNAYSGATDQKTQAGIPHPELYRELKKQRDNFCARKDLPVYMVAGSKTLEEMARYLPQSLAELKEISGFGEAKINAYGQQFLDIVLKYCSERQLSSCISEKAPKRQRKQKDHSKASDTKAESFRLFKEGKSAMEIAQERNLTVQTIEGHLAYYVQGGEIDITDLITPEKASLISSSLKGFNGESLTTIKEKLGNNIGYGEIRLTLAWLAFKKEHQSL